MRISDWSSDLCSSDLVLRALSKEPETREAFFGELLAALGAHADLDREVHWLTQAFDVRATLELRSRTNVERMALAQQASVLLLAATDSIAKTWCSSRTGCDNGITKETCDEPEPHAEMISRHFDNRSAQK